MPSDCKRSPIPPAAVPQRSDSSFRNLITALELDPSRILDVGAGGFVGETTTIHLLDLFPEAKLTAVELDPGRADALRERFGERIEVVTGDVARYLPEQPFDLTVIDLDSSAVPLVFDDLLEQVLVPLTRPGGVIVTNLALDLYNAYHGPRPLLTPENEPLMCAFMLRRFGHLLLTDTRIKAAFAEHSDLTPIVTIEKWPGERANMMGWLALHCHPDADRWPEYEGSRADGGTAGEAGELDLAFREFLVEALTTEGALALDLVGDPTVCTADCATLVQRWSNWCRAQFGSSLRADDPVVSGFVPNSSLSDESIEADTVVPPLPLAMLEIPASTDEYMGRVSPTARNKVRKAERHGYVFREFDYNAHLDDLFAINTSKPVRAGGAMKEHLLSRPEPIEAGDYCGLHGATYFGAFEGETLVAYIQLVRLNELGIFNQILGHGDHLANGVMNGLVSYVVDWCIASGHIRAINYLTIVDSAESLNRFKLSVGFRSRAVAFRIPSAVGAPA